MKRVITLIAVFAATLLLAAPAAAGTTVWVVDNDRADCQKADFTTIQAAVTAAAPGDTILVCAGIYHERVSITTSEITLRAKGAPGAVTVDADHLGHGILLSGAHGVTIEGFTVREGHDNDIFLVNANGNTIRENILTAAVHDPLELLNSDDNLIEQNLSVDNLGANACGIFLAAGSDHPLELVLRRANGEEFTAEAITSQDAATCSALSAAYATTTRSRLQAMWISRSDLPRVTARATTSNATPAAVPSWVGWCSPR